MKDVVIHLCILTIMCNYVCVYIQCTCIYMYIILIYNVMYNLSFMFHFYLGSKNDENKKEKKRAQLGLYSHCSSSSQCQELMEKISPLLCNDVKVQL